MTDQSPKVLTRADPEKQRRLVETAAGEFARVGFERANIDAIAVRAGVGKGTVYLYFASKADLFHAVLAEVRIRLEAALTDDRSTDGVTLLRRYIRAQLLLAEAAPDLFRCYTSALFGVNRDFQVAALAIFSWQQAYLRALLAQVGAAGTVDQLDARAALLAASVLAAGLVRGLRYDQLPALDLAEATLLHGFLAERDGP